MSSIDGPSAVVPPPASRKAEETDTRQALHRHDPEFYRKKKDDSEPKGFEDPYEDLTDVSIPALKNFLMGLLDRMPQNEAVAVATTTIITHEAERTAASPRAAAAMQAYKTGAQRGSMAPPPAPLPPVDAQPPAASALDQAAANLDRASVLELIRALDRLYAQGITGITLEKGDGFLASIRAAVDKASASIRL